MLSATQHNETLNVGLQTAQPNLQNRHKKTTQALAGLDGSDEGPWVRAHAKAG